jgi:hypothetical protein
MIAVASTTTTAVSSVDNSVSVQSTISDADADNITEANLKATANR